MPPFRFEPPPTGNSGTLGELLFRSNDAAAQAAAQKGQIWGRAAEQIGGSLGQLALAPSIQRREQRQAEMDNARLALQQEQVLEARRRREAEQEVGGILARNLGQDGLYNVQGMAEDLKRAPSVGHLAGPMLKDAITLNETLTTHRQQRAATEQGLINEAIEATMRTPSKTPDALAMALQQRVGPLLSRERASSFVQSLDQSSPESFEQSLITAWRGKPLREKLGQGDVMTETFPWDAKPREIAKGAEKIEPAIADDRKYMGIVARKRQGEDVSPEEEAYVYAYERKKDLSATKIQIGGQPDYVERYARELNKDPKDLTTAEIDAARKKYAAADDKPTVTRYQRAEVTINGEPVLANYDALTGKYHDLNTGQQLTGIDVKATADMRNKQAGRQLVAKSIEAIKDLGDRIITRVGPSQRAAALSRGAEAVFGNDPEFRTYQDARMALAGNLAVAQQGSRPSDADIKSIWLPLVPDPFRDTADSSRMKWDLLDRKSTRLNSSHRL